MPGAGCWVHGCTGAEQGAGLQERVVVAHEQRLVGGSAEATRLDDDAAYAAGAQEGLTRRGGSWVNAGTVQAECSQAQAMGGEKGDGPAGRGAAGRWGSPPRR